MHQIILLTAMTATSGLFGGGRHCGGGRCGTPTVSYGCAAPVAYYQPHYTYPQPCAPCGVATYATAQPCAPCGAPSYAAPQAVPAPQLAPVPPAPAAPPKAALAPRAGYYSPGVYYYYPAAPSCATGNCPNR